MESADNLGKDDIEWQPLALTLVMYPKGTLINELINIILKHTICENRPLVRSNLYNEYGMPSSHSQFMWFFSFYVLYFFIFRLHHLNNNNIISALWRVIIVSSCFMMALIVSIGRVYLEYHTRRQVVVGAIVGIVTATVWKISEMLMIRDTTLIPNVLWFEYTTSRHEARARGRKMAAHKPAQ
ncbi:unnamed protein product [Leptidea sinapis]|uniref:Dolichyldiphosphatase 1 n=1 Tax=Leptidea sinapis TaxID=189913 RepID=A0A5E4Q385_9NEOP|nr:unnamed protein product [Leptidea sinapis]